MPHLLGHRKILNTTILLEATSTHAPCTAAATQGPTPQPRIYSSMCHSTHEKSNQSVQQNSYIHTADETRPIIIIENNPQDSWATLLVVWLLPTNWSPLKSFSYFYSPVRCVCLCIHWVAVQNTKQRRPIHVGGVSLPVFFFFSFSFLAMPPSWGHEPVALSDSHHASHRPPHGLNSQNQTIQTKFNFLWWLMANSLPPGLSPQDTQQDLVCSGAALTAKQHLVQNHHFWTPKKKPRPSKAYWWQVPELCTCWWALGHAVKQGSHLVCACISWYVCAHQFHDACTHPHTTYTRT